MATTTNYSFTLPTVGGSENEWGTNLNANWTALDTLLGGVTATEFGVLSGIPALTGNEGKAVAVANDGSALTYVDFPEGSVYLAGSGLTLSGSTFSHADTSTQASVNNSGNTFIQDISVDEFGHITAITSATSTATANDSTISIVAGTNLTGGGSFTTNQASNSSITLNASESGLGISTQNLQFVLGSRSAGTTYQNGTSQPIWVGVAYASQNNEGFQWSPNGSTWYDLANLGNARHMPVSVVIPPGYSYRIYESSPGNVYSLTGWSEYR